MDAAVASVGKTSRQSVRLEWIDHLRTLVIILVVNVHACVTYSHVGGWYIVSPQEPSLAQKIPFILWETHLQSFFMGLLFFLAAFFAHDSIRRRGGAGFMRERLRRLGLPTALYVFVIHPFIVRGLNPWDAKFPPPMIYYRNYIASGQFLSGTGPMWFAAVLLMFSLVFAAWRSVRAPSPDDTAPRPPPSGLAIFLLAASLGAVSFLVRLRCPIGSSFYNMQLCFFPQYIAALALGVSASKHGWLVALAQSPMARRSGIITVIAAPIVLVVGMFLGVKDGVDSFAGGWTWEALYYGVWEQLTGFGLSLGLLSLFSTYMVQNAPVLRWMDDRSFAVYLLHPPILVALYLALRPLPANPYFMAALMTFAGLGLSFLTADLARRTPVLKRIL